MSVLEKEAVVDKEEEEKKFYKEAFEAFDWNRNGTIPTSVSSSKLWNYFTTFWFKSYVV